MEYALFYSMVTHNFSYEVTLTLFHVLLIGVSYILGTCLNAFQETCEKAQVATGFFVYLLVCTQEAFFDLEIVISCPDILDEETKSAPLKIAEDNLVFRAHDDDYVLETVVDSCYVGTHVFCSIELHIHFLTLFLNEMFQRPGALLVLDSLNLLAFLVTYRHHKLVLLMEMLDFLIDNDAFWYSIPRYI